MHIETLSAGGLSLDIPIQMQVYMHAAPGVDVLHTAGLKKCNSQ